MLPMPPDSAHDRSLRLTLWLVADHTAYLPTRPPEVAATRSSMGPAAFATLTIEMGLLVRDRTLAATTVLHFQTLIQQGLLHLLPSS